MNKSLISLAIAAVLSATSLTTQADEDYSVKVYGKVHVGYGLVVHELTGTGATTTLSDNWQFRSFASRLGVKGSTKISDSLKGIFKLEYGVDPDGDYDKNGDNTAGLSRRNQYLGLAGNFGTVLFGRHDTPTKIAQGKFDQFNDTDADIKGALKISRAENRFDNILAYSSPTWGGFSFMAAIAPGEGDGTTGGGDGPADTISLMAQFEMKGLMVSLAHDGYDDTTGGLADSLKYKDLNRLVVTYKIGMFNVGGLYETSTKTSETIGTDKDVMGVSGAVTFAEKHKIKLQYMMGEEDISGSENKKTNQFSFGYDFKMTKTNTVYAMYTVGVNDEGVDDDDEYAYFGVGMIQNF